MFCSAKLTKQKHDSMLYCENVSERFSMYWTSSLVPFFQTTNSYFVILVSFFILFTYPFYLSLNTTFNIFKHLFPFSTVAFCLIKIRLSGFFCSFLNSFVCSDLYSSFSSVFLSFARFSSFPALRKFDFLKLCFLCFITVPTSVLLSFVCSFLCF